MVWGRGYLYEFNSLWLSDVIQRQIWVNIGSGYGLLIWIKIGSGYGFLIWVDIGSGNGLVLDGIKPLPEPMLNNH